MKAKRPRPMVGKTPTYRYTVSLPSDVADRLVIAGAGNLSAGIRMAEKALNTQRK